MRRLLTLLVSVLFGLGLMACSEGVTASKARASASSTSSSATTRTFSTTVPVQQRTDLVACPNRGTVVEPVQWSGALHLVVHTTENQNNTRLKMQENFNIEGAGLQTGNTWRIIESESTTHNLGSGLPVTFTNTGTLLSVSQGSQPNLVAKTLFRVTVSASGIQTVDLNEFDVNCRG